MNTEYLKTFVTLAQVGSYTKTAQQMIVVPSTISKQIKQLEMELGKQLIIRDKKSVQLTKAGEIFLEYAYRMLDTEAACINDLEAIVDSGANIRIGTLPSLFQSHVTAWLNSYFKNNPNIRCSVVTGHSHTLLNKLYDGDIDLCFSYRSFWEHNCECIPFVKDEMILVTGPGNPAYDHGITIAELKTLPLIKESQLSVASLNLHKEIFDHNENVVLSVGMGNLIVPFLKDGNGYGFAVKRYVQKELETGELTQISILDQPRLFLQSYLIYKKANVVVTNVLLEHIFRYVQNLD